MIKQASNKGPNCYVKGEGVVHKKKDRERERGMKWSAWEWEIVCLMKLELWMADLVK